MFTILGLAEGWIGNCDSQAGGPCLLTDLSCLLVGELGRLSSVPPFSPPPQKDKALQKQQSPQTVSPAAHTHFKLLISFLSDYSH